MPDRLDKLVQEIKDLSANLTPEEQQFIATEVDKLAADYRAKADAADAILDTHQAAESDRKFPGGVE